MSLTARPNTKFLTVPSEPGTKSTLREHLAPEHVQVLDGEAENLLQWARTVGRSAVEMVTYHLTLRRDPANGLKAVRKMHDLARDHGNDRFEEACEYALKANITSLRSVISIVKERPDRAHNDNAEAKRPIHHQNVRGPDYYKELGQ